MSQICHGTAFSSGAIAGTSGLTWLFSNLVASGFTSGYMSTMKFTDGGYYVQKMDKRQFLYLVETRPQVEQGFMLALYTNGDELTRQAYADWLEENGRVETAKAVRDGWAPGIY